MTLNFNTLRRRVLPSLEFPWKKRQVKARNEWLFNIFSKAEVQVVGSVFVSLLVPRKQFFPYAGLTFWMQCLQMINRELQDFGFFQFRWALLLKCWRNKSLQFNEWRVDSVSAFLLDYTATLLTGHQLATVIFDGWRTVKQKKKNHVENAAIIEITSLDTHCSFDDSSE